MPHPSDSGMPVAVVDDHSVVHAGIAGSQLVIVPHAGHTSSIEQPAAVLEALEAHLAAH